MSLWPEASWNYRRQRHRTIASLSIVVLLVACLVAARASWSGAPGEGLVVPVRVPLALDQAGMPVVPVRLGNDASVYVQIDTGSVGLRLLAQDLPTGAHTGITVTAQHDSIEYADGSVVTGRVATARFAIGSLDTPSNVSFELVERTSCARGYPQCPASGGALLASGVAGIMGIGLYGVLGADPVPNPLELLRGAYSQRWSLALRQSQPSLAAFQPDSGSLVVGASPPTGVQASFGLQQLVQGDGNNPGWDDRPVMCWRFDGFGSCAPTVLDSGSTYVNASTIDVPTGHGAVSLVHIGPGISAISPGVWVSVSQSNGSTPFWRFQSSEQQPVIVRQGQQGIVAGVSFFFSHTVFYDADSGTISVSD